LEQLKVLFPGAAALFVARRIADTLGKAVVMDSPHSPHMQAYIRACEYFISVASLPNTQPFSGEELQVIRYYVEELSKVVKPVKKS